MDERLADGVVPVAGQILEDEEEERRLRKRLKKEERALETRVLDPWERYRAMSDMVEAFIELAELADRKSRFALLIMGALNAINVIVVLQPELLGRITGGARMQIGAYVAGYAVLSLVFFVYAILTLKPRVSSIFGKAAAVAPGDSGILGLRFVGDILASNLEDYYDRWRQATIGQLNRELALHLQLLSRVNRAKYAALERLYVGLLVLVGLTAILVFALGYRAVVHA